MTTKKPQADKATTNVMTAPSARRKAQRKSDPEAEKQKTHPLGRAITNYVTNLSNLRDFVSLIGPFLKQQHATLMQERDVAPFLLMMSMIKGASKEAMPTVNEEQIRKDFGDKLTFSVDPDGKRCSMTVNDEALEPRIANAMKRMSTGTQHHSLLYRSSLISLVSSAEWFLSQMMRYYYQAFPDAAGVKEKSLKLDDLMKLGSIEDAKQYLINLKIDEIMWGGLEDWLHTLATTMKLSMGYLESDKQALVEVFQRRNVMVHNNGVVHSSYLTKVAEELRVGVKAHSELTVEPEYLERAIDLLEITFILIAAELWKKLEPKDEKRAAVLTNTVAFHALTTERWKIAEGASRFAMGDSGMSESARLNAKLNYWQSLKWQGRFSEVVNDVEKEDFSAKDDIFQLARFTLLDMQSQAVAKIKAMLRSGKLETEHLQNWPIFRELRKLSEIMALMEKSDAESGSKRGESADRTYIN